MKPEIKVGEVYEDCAYHPVRCTEVWDDSVSGVSLLDGTSPRSCSLYSCGVRLLNEVEIAAAKKAWKEEGAKGLAKLQGWTDEEFKVFEDKWGIRNSTELKI